MYNTRLCHNHPDGAGLWEKCRGGKFCKHCNHAGMLGYNADFGIALLDVDWVK
jgi:hypothetical protein